MNLNENDKFSCKRREKVVSNRFQSLTTGLMNTLRNYSKVKRFYAVLHLELILKRLSTMSKQFYFNCIIYVINRANGYINVKFIKCLYIMLICLCLYQL